jgi:protein-L-isoaspartate(D-aspartate) O-methyltransferase
MMVSEQIERRGIHEQHLLDALCRVPRHLFIPGVRILLAYADCALAISAGQTISQPYIVALMTDKLALKGDETILEVGTGSGYQAAVLSCLCRRVITLERIGELAERAARILAELHYDNIEVHHDDGSTGWPGAAPYQGIIVTAAAPEVPEPLLEQLADGGRLVIPVGSPSEQKLQVWQRMGETRTCQDILPVTFVPLRGVLGWTEEEWRQEDK